MRTMTDRPASWKYPKPQEMAREISRIEREAAIRRNCQTSDPGPFEPLPDALWEAVLADPRTASARKPGKPIQQSALAEIRQHVLRVECDRCLRLLEIQTADAIRLYGPRAVWKDVGQRLLDQTCPNRTGRHEEDGCWPRWK